MGVLPKKPLKDESSTENLVKHGAAEGGAESSRNETLRQRIGTLLGRFDIDDKDLLARELAQMLELRASDDLAGKAGEALGDTLTESEKFRLQILGKLVRDRDLTRKEDPFPDDFGSPKSGL